MIELDAGSHALPTTARVVVGRPGSFSLIDCDSAFVCMFVCLSFRACLCICSCFCVTRYHCEPGFLSAQFILCLCLRECACVLESVCVRAAPDEVEMIDRRVCRDEQMAARLPKQIFGDFLSFRDFALTLVRHFLFPAFPLFQSHRLELFLQPRER